MSDQENVTQPDATPEPPTGIFPAASAEWIPARDGIQEIYSNYTHLNWTLFDVRIRLGQLVPHPADTDPTKLTRFVVEERAALTMAWAEAKVLVASLQGLIDSYEKTNGELKPLKMAPPPPLS